LTQRRNDFGTLTVTTESIGRYKISSSNGPFPESIVFKNSGVVLYSDQLGIPATNYSASIRLTSSEYRRICTDLSALGDSVIMEISNQGIKFEVYGDIGKGSVTLKPASKDENIVDREGLLDEITRKVMPESFCTGCYFFISKQKCKTIHK
jgi:hypothetical protein